MMCVNPCNDVSVCFVIEVVAGRDTYSCALAGVIGGVELLRKLGREGRSVGGGSVVEIWQAFFFGGSLRSVRS